MKKVYIRFTISFIIISIVLFLVLAAGSWFRSMRTIEDALEQILNQTESFYIQQQENAKLSLGLIQDDYINRTSVIAFIMSHNDWLATSENVEKLRSLMDVDKINVVDKDGIIRASTLPNTAGLNLRDFPRASELLALAQGESDKDMLVSVGQFDEMGRRIVDYVAMRVDNPVYSAVEITFHSAKTEEVLRTTNIHYMLETFMTEYRTIVAAFGKDGSMLGITTNNPQELLIPGVETRDEVLALLTEAKDGYLCKLNGSFGYMLARDIDDFTLCACYDIHSALQDMMQQLLATGLLMLLSMLLILFILNHYFARYMRLDFMHMQQDIDAFLGGDTERNIRPCTNQEIEPLRKAIASMREGYRHKTERLNKIFGERGSNIAVFECLGYTNSLFFSDNLKQILGVDDQTFRTVTASISAFDAFLQGIQKNANDDGIAPLGDKFLRVNMYRKENELFGLVVDKTAEQRKRTREMELMYRDVTTGLYRRLRFEQYMHALFENTPQQEGVLLMIDMDNLKTINDTYGHPGGDRALRTLARCLTQVFRRDDLIGRVGGDEFAIYISDPISQGTLEEKDAALRRALQEAGESDPGFPTVSVSIGAAYASDTLNSLEALYSAADSALYIAKQQGKGQIHVHEEDEHLG